MATLQPKGSIDTIVEQGNSSLVHSRIRSSSHVHAVCHHSDEYLSRDEMAPYNERLMGLKTQYDFPGIPDLDETFRSAAHAPNAVHLSWNPPALFGAVLIVLGIFLLIGAYFIQATNTLLATTCVGFAVLALVGGGLLIWKRHTVYHQLVRHGLPARLHVDDFPLACTYDVVTEEYVRADLDNSRNAPPTPSDAHGSVEVALYPEELTQRQLRDYLRVWGNSGFGRWIYAGLVAFEKTADVTFHPSAHLDRGHRLRLAAAMPQTFRQGIYNAKSHGPLLRFQAPYALKQQAMYTEKDPVSRLFPLECVPFLDPGDSYTLYFQLRWLNDNGGNCFLQECRLKIPSGLDVNQVVLGHYDRSTKEAIWKGIRFSGEKNQQSLTLAVRCKNPILTYHQTLVGTYVCGVMNSTLSKLTVNPEHIWNARGLKAVGDKAPYIEHATLIEGRLTIDITRLMQEHEFTATETVVYQNRTTEEVVSRVMDVFRQLEIDLLRITQAAPRLDPAGTLSTELYYWDIIGRKYQTAMMLPIDFHVVIKGEQYQPLPNTAFAPLRSAQLDLNVRCLHDPRNTNMPVEAASLLQQIQSSL